MAEENGDKKSRFVENFYEDADGNKKPRPFKGVVAVGKIFKESGYVLRRDLRDLDQDMLLQAAAFGITQVSANAFGGAKNEPDRITAATDRLDTIFEDGVWASGRQEGPRISDIFEATVEAYAEAGKPLSEEQQDDLKKGLAEGTYKSKDLQENPKIKAKLFAIRARKAEERAKKVAEAAGSQTVDLGDLASFASTDEEE